MQFLGRKKGLAIVFAAAVLGAAVLAAYCLREKPPVYPEADRFATPYWNDLGVLFLRSNTTGGMLLACMRDELKFTIKPGDPPILRETVYEYPGDSTPPRMVPREVWEALGNPVMDCSRRIPLYTNHFQIHYGDHAIRFDGKEVPTVGRAALQGALSPNEELAAVLSARGKYRNTGFAFMWGAGRASGPRYHQFFRVADGTPIGEPVVLANAPDSDTVVSCWSPDGRFVAYTDMFMTQVWVVPAPAEPDEPK